MALRDSFESDLDIFIDTDEFAVTKTINGTPMKVVWDTASLKRFEDEDMQLADPAGIYDDTLIMEVKKSLYGSKPGVGERVTVDDSFYLIIDVNEWEGLFEITLQIIGA